MKPEKNAGLSYELLLFITVAEPFELIAVHFLISRFNTTIAWMVTILSVLSVASLWVLWFRQQLQTKFEPEAQE